VRLVNLAVRDAGKHGTMEGAYSDLFSAVCCGRRVSMGRRRIVERRDCEARRVVGAGGAR
jgi:hypothetical protein